MPYLATFAIGYNGRALHMGEILDELDGCPNDNLLVSMNLLRVVEKDDLKDAIKCDMCGCKFMSVSYLHAHRSKGVCGGTVQQILDSSNPTDREIISNLPDRKRDSIRDI